MAAAEGSLRVVVSLGLLDMIGVLTSSGWLALPWRDFELAGKNDRGVPGVGGSGVDGAETKLISEGDWISL